MKRKTTGSEQGHRIDLLSLTTAYRNNPGPFARPGPPPKPPLPLKFTCRKCGGRVNPDNGTCSGCLAVYDF